MADCENYAEPALAFCRKIHENRHMRRHLRVTLLLAMMGVLLTGAAASAQPYGASLGDLLSPVGAYAPGDTVSVTGDGFLADSAVEITLLANVDGSVFELGSATASASGAVDATAVLPMELEAGSYTVSATGVTEDGATRVLSSEIDIVAEEPATTTTTTVATAETTAAPSTTTTEAALESEAPEALPFPEDDADGGSSTGLFVGGGALILLAVGGFTWWRYRAATR